MSKLETKAVILAAGRGSRMDKLTDDLPKCMVNVGNKSILDHQIEAYFTAGIQQIIIIVGYKSNQIVSYCEKWKYSKQNTITIIENADYSNTNNMYSLYLARGEVSGCEFLLSNGDIIFNPEIIMNLTYSNITDAFVGDRIAKIEKHMKFTIDDSGYVNNIGMDIHSSHEFINSVSLLKLSSTSSKHLFNEMEKIIKKEKNAKEWFELALNRLIQQEQIKLKYIDVDGKLWVEIDDNEDLLRAESLFGKMELI